MLISSRQEHASQLLPPTPPVWTLLLGSVVLHEGKCYITDTLASVTLVDVAIT